MCDINEKHCNPTPYVHDAKYGKKVSRDAYRERSMLNVLLWSLYFIVKSARHILIKLQVGALVFVVQPL